MPGRFVYPDGIGQDVMLEISLEGTEIWRYTPPAESQPRFLDRCPPVYSMQAHRSPARAVVLSTDYKAQKL
jgi:hypothetical protein